MEVILPKLPINRRADPVYIAYSLASCNWLGYSTVSPAEAIGNAIMSGRDVSAEFLVVIRANHAPGFTDDVKAPMGEIVWRGSLAQNFRVDDPDGVPTCSWCERRADEGHASDCPRR